ncbi:MAG TPA: ABC transporter ATP-binding protein [Thermodesulfobacteriota bacterium]|nr:ABC transporter ATP-binding protein [Thermodesulfobacteriota bacterium]
MALLSTEEIIKEYDGIRALDRISLKVEKGSIKGLIGPNGAGKSTLFHLISGVEKPDSGKIYFKGKEIRFLEPHERSALGIGRTFQTLQVWGNMTVVENIMAGMNRRLKGGYLSCGLRFPWIRKSENEVLKEAKEILDSLGLLGKWESLASQLPYGKQKLLELGRALAMKPELLLLDEPASGLTLAEIEQLSQHITKVRQEGVTVFIVEHHMGMVMEIADEIAVLHNGELIAEGRPEAVRMNPRVIEAYLTRRGGK